MHRHHDRQRSVVEQPRGVQFPSNVVGVVVGAVGPGRADADVDMSNRAEPRLFAQRASYALLKWEQLHRAAPHLLRGRHLEQGGGVGDGCG